MSTKTKETLTVISQEEIGRDIYSLWLQTDQMAPVSYTHLTLPTIA